MKSIKKNPFTVTTPETMTAEEVEKLFVDVFTDFPKVLRPGHLFLHGPRGSGKSMIFRYLSPDCQILAQDKALNEIEFYSIYIPLKTTDLKITELNRLEGKHAAEVLNEHIMVIAFTKIMFDQLNTLNLNQKNISDDLIKLGNSLLSKLKTAGFDRNIEQFTNENTKKEIIGKCIDILEVVYGQIVSYLNRLSFSSKIFTYDGPICGYMDFFHPLLVELRKLSFMPNGPIFLLIDDADNLSLTQTEILNTWVSRRTIADISLKISTQLQYKTYFTSTGHTIDTPHDFSEINISTIYTTSFKNKYRNRIYEIVRKRLSIHGKDIDPNDFFPVDEDQEKKIQEIGQEYRDKWEKEGSGYRPSDDVIRYSRPDFFKSLAGSSKSSASYSYAGFEQLVHVSSGIIRYFLEPASKMFSKYASQNNLKDIQCIPPNIQNDVIKEESDDFLYSEFDRHYDDKSEYAHDADKLNNLYNLLKSLGGTFRQILLSDRSERRVFSIAFSNSPDEEILEVLKLGIQLGYFHVSSIGNKDGTGKTKLYVLSRRLAPHFKLDPTSFAGYLFVTSNSIRRAMYSPDKLLRKIKREGIDKIFEQRQLKIFE